MVVIKLDRADEFAASHTLRGFARRVISSFDLSPDTIPQHAPYRLPDLPDTWGIGLIVGASGTGKSTLLRRFREPSQGLWSGDESVLDAFERMSVWEPTDRLNAAGLNSVPTWVRPIRLLSTGERFRAELALSLRDDAVVDEYTSVVSRSVAISASMAVRKWVKRTGAQRLVFASCHQDIVEPLQPDWIIDTDNGTYTDDVSWRPEEWWKSHVTGQSVGSLGWK